MLYTADADEDGLDIFYEHIDEALKITRHREMTIVLGDSNAKIGKGQSGKIIAHYGLVQRNERGDNEDNIRIKINTNT